MDNETKLFKLEHFVFSVASFNSPGLSTEVLNLLALEARKLLAHIDSKLIAPFKLGPNARLVATAPKMLLALEAVWAEYEPEYIVAGSGDIDDGRIELDVAFDLVRDVLAEAKGE